MNLQPKERFSTQLITEDELPVALYQDVDNTWKPIDSQFFSDVRDGKRQNTLIRFSDGAQIRITDYNELVLVMKNR